MPNLKVNNYGQNKEIQQSTPPQNTKTCNHFNLKNNPLKGV